VRIPCQLSEVFEEFIKIIPASPRPDQKKRAADFTRNRALPFPRLIACVLSLVGGGKTEGVDNEMDSFFKLARRSNHWPQAQAPTRGALTKARAKIPWEVFREIFEKTVALAWKLWPEREDDHWRGMNVLAIDGSKYNLPATEKMREEFDPDSGLGKPGKGHYPQCMVSTLYDVFRGLPLARTVAPYRSCERKEAVKLLESAPDNSLVVFDRGYPAYWFFRHLIENFSGHFLMRCSATGTFAAVTDFLNSSRGEALIDVAAPTTTPVEARKRMPMLRLRAIRSVSPDGKVCVFLTSLLDARAFPKDEIVKMYFKRWEVEVYYREEKIIQELERFHSRAPLGVRQEFFAVTALTVLSRTMAVLSEEIHNLPAGRRSQRKHAAISLAREVSLLIPANPLLALACFDELLRSMARIKYHRPKRPRPPAPRITKAPRNKWATRAKAAALP